LEESLGILRGKMKLLTQRERIESMKAFINMLITSAEGNTAAQTALGNVLETLENIGRGIDEKLNE